MTNILFLKTVIKCIFKQLRNHLSNKFPAFILTVNSQKRKCHCSVHGSSPGNVSHSATDKEAFRRLVRTRDIALQLASLWLRHSEYSAVLAWSEQSQNVDTARILQTSRNYNFNSIFIFSDNIIIGVTHFRLKCPSLTKTFEISTYMEYNIHSRYSRRYLISAE